MVRLETERLIVRDNVPDDLYNLHTLLSDKINMYYLDDIATSSFKESGSNLKHAMANKDGHYFCIEKKDGDYIGQIGYTISDSSPAGKTVHMGYFILPARKGYGYAAEAAKEVIRFAFEKDGCVRISTGCFKDNEASRRVMEKAGFRMEAEKPEAMYHDGIMKDRLEYAINRSEYCAG